MLHQGYVGQLEGMVGWRHSLFIRRITMSASVKIMLSYDYCHFEICKGTDENLTNEQVNDLRKDCQRLADEAVRQYQVAKQHAAKLDSYEKKDFDRRIKGILKKEESTLTIEETAMLKQYRDEEFQKQFEPYDYDDEDEREW
jgi:coenzyme F420-reducing hydrogenase alpha subunit